MITDNKIFDSGAIVNLISRRLSHLSRHQRYFDSLEGLSTEDSRHIIGEVMETLDNDNTIKEMEGEKLDYSLSMEVIL